MKGLLPFPHRDLHPLARLRAWHRLSLAAFAGLLTAQLAPFPLWEARLLAAWTTGATLYLIVVWWGIGRLDAGQTRLRASSYDPGTAALYAAIVSACWVSLAGVLLVADAARTLAGAARWGHIGLALSSLAVTWLLVQSIFALRYARRYYRPRETRQAASNVACPPTEGGLVFPGGEAPAYADFAYFSAVIGMTAQVADVGIASAAMRRLVLAHGLVAFAFNLLVLGLVINLLSGALG